MAILSLPLSSTSPFLFLLLLLLLPCHHGFNIKEATVHDIQVAFQQQKLSSRQLVLFYLDQIRILNPILHAVIEINPDALHQADVADQERSDGKCSKGPLHGIPILLKDNIATADQLNSTAGSLALLGSVVPRDAGVVTRLRDAGAVILGKASLSEWSKFRSTSTPNGWSARGGQGKNPYVLSADTCGSSSGSAIAVAANLVTVSLGTETDGSILCPSSFNSVVGIKPTVGLTSRSGVIPISSRQDTVGPICRTVSDAVYVLDAIVGFDPRDAEATGKASKLIPYGGYTQFLKADGLKGKRLGIVRKPFFEFLSEPAIKQTFDEHLNTLRQRGAILVDNLEIANVSDILNVTMSGEEIALLTEFKLSINAYLSELVHSPVRSLADLIAFNNKYSTQEKAKEFGQDIFLAAQSTNVLNENVRSAIKNMKRLSEDGFKRTMKDNKLDAMVTPDSFATTVLAIGGYPGISIPAGYETGGVPIGICFGGLHGSEPKLIEITYDFEQATMIRKPPSFKP
ncbi:probable amidase At4g34880 [Magnolia sinica]|uniref:probable amidase At4g34880 n=1 Tax=Magnolia sinica TaxID=86752 RepID=UPI0026594014|nr:probable amidase At4g34880 [Magnolia sinica]